MIPKQTAFLFPGQGSQKLGMGHNLVQNYPTAQATFNQAEDILGLNISRIAWEGPVELLNDTANTQPALLVHSIAVWRVFKEIYPDLQPAYVAGHSLGELSSLVAAEALSFEESLGIVHERGRLMKKAGETSNGGMAAVLGMDIPYLEKICSQASSENEVVIVANDNCPGQVVISGTKNALERAMSMAREAGARRVIPLAVSIASHSPVMVVAQEEFKWKVESTPILDPQIPIIGNVSAKPLKTANQIRSDLQLQLTSRVRWTESIQYLLNNGINTFIEFGSGNVLTGLLRRIDRNAVGIPIGEPEDFEVLP
jgi:[acyl-carrier-protein] S-malonyltransferase